RVDNGSLGDENPETADSGDAPGRPTLRPASLWIFRRHYRSRVIHVWSYSCLDCFAHRCERKAQGGRTEPGGQRWNAPPARPDVRWRNWLIADSVGWRWPHGPEFSAPHRSRTWFR